MMAVTGRRRGLGSLMLVLIMMMVMEMVTGESIMDFLRRRSDLSQVRDRVMVKQNKKQGELALAVNKNFRSFKLTKNTKHVQFNENLHS